MESENGYETLQNIETSHLSSRFVLTNNSTSLFEHIDETNDG